MTERTFVMIKPDGVQRGLIGEIIHRIERKGFRLVALKMLELDAQKASQHYQEHAEKTFFQELIGFITSGPSVVMVWEGERAISTIRQLMGKTNPCEALPGTIRGDLAQATNFNLIHGSDSASAAFREIELFFAADEIHDYTRELDCWIG